MNAPPRLAAAIRATAAELRADIGPPITRYAVLLDTPGLWRFVVANEDTDDGWTTIGHSGGTTGRWKIVRQPNQGDDLAATAAQTIAVADGPVRTMPASVTLTETVTLTLDDEGAEEGDTLDLVRLTTSAYTVVIVNGGTGAGTLATMPISARSKFKGYFDGTNWTHRDSGLLL